MMRWLKTSAIGAALLPLAMAALAAAAPAARADDDALGPHAKHGAALIQAYGCGSCHTVPGIDSADGVVGPPLNNIGRRIYIAGMLRNTPDNLMLWIQHPQKIVPGNAMPDMGVNAPDARDIAAYLDTLR